MEMNQETTGTGGGGAAGGIPVECRGRVLPGEDGQEPGEGEEKRREIPGGKGVRKQREIHGAEGLKASLSFWNAFWLPAAKNPFKKAAPCDKIGRKTTGRIFEDENSSNL